MTCKRHFSFQLSALSTVVGSGNNCVYVQYDSLLYPLHFYVNTPLTARNHKY